MRVRPMPKPQVLLSGALEDRGRFLFLKKIEHEKEVLELPCVITAQGSNPISQLAALFQSAFGIDAQVHETVHQGRHNAGSRRFKRWIPALVFRITAKNAHAKPSAGLGYAWLSIEDARKHKLSRNSEWL